MANYIYLTNPARLKSFLVKIQEVGVPDKLTSKHLSGMGFKGTNDRPIISAMKALGFVSSSGEPIERWQLYRDKNQAPAVLAQAVKEHYHELYQMYPDAHLKDTEALRNFFSTHTTVSGGTLSCMIGTFKAVASLADFDAISPRTVSKPQGAALEVVSDKIRAAQPGKSGLALNINIQLTLPEGSTPDTFEAFFKAMRKHLFD